MRFDRGSQLFNSYTLIIFSLVVSKPERHLFSIKMLNVLFQFPLMLRRQDRIIFAKIVGIERVRCGDHLFMDLLSRPEADHFLYAIGANGCGYIGYFVRWVFGDEDLTTPCVVQCV